jgi:hypothetical protein
VSSKSACEWVRHPVNKWDSPFLCYKKDALKYTREIVKNWQAKRHSTKTGGERLILAAAAWWGKTGRRRLSME